MNPTPASSDTDLRIVRVFRARRSRVFDAFLNPDAMRQWFCPPGFVFDSIDVNPRSGHGRRFSMRDLATGHSYVFDLDYTLIERPSRIRWTSTWHEGFPEPGRKTIATIEFREVADGTEVTLTHEGFADAATRDVHREGWSGGLGKLTKYLEELPAGD